MSTPTPANTPLQLQPQPIQTTQSSQQPTSTSTPSLQPLPLSFLPTPYAPAGGVASTASGSLQLQPAPLTFQPASINAANTSATTTTSNLQPLSLQPMPLTLQPTQPQSASAAASSAGGFSLQPQPLSFTPLTVASTNSTQPNGPTMTTPVAQTAGQPAPASAAAAPLVPTPAASAGAPSAVAPPRPDILVGLPIVDDEKALEQCQEWSFFVELIEDVFKERESTLNQLEATIVANDHLQFQREAHALKGAALNLHLPALVDISKKAEIVGKQLVVTPQAQEYLDARRPMLEHLVREYKRLEDVLPIYREKAENELGEEEGEMEEYED